jgi:hypothetical protein
MTLRYGSATGLLPSDGPSPFVRVRDLTGHNKT